MVGEDDNDRYRAGKIDQELKGINNSLLHITEKLDKNLEWQSEVNSRCVSGGIRIETLEKNRIRDADDIEALKNKDRGVLALASAIGGAIGAGTAAAIKFFGG